MRKLRDLAEVCIYAVNRISKRFEADNLTAYAAQAAFFIFISVFPFLMLFLNLLKYIPIFSAENMENLSLSFLSPQIETLIKDIIAEASASGSGALISITTVTILWACSKGVLGIIYGLNSIYKTTEKRSFVHLRVVAVFYTVGLIVALVIVLILMVFGNKILDLIVQNITLPISLTNAVRTVRWLVTFGFLILFFMFLYTVIPERKTKLKNELPGAVVSAVGWIGFSALYSFYIDNFGNQSKVYGSLTAIILFLLWMYICMIILFVGAEINDALQEHNFIAAVKEMKEEKRQRKKIKAKIKK
ncbi:MAG: YihY/virulence factor BrkB family protein [Firmicutes bacterium]|nr:YihY/virulence factor BrkB family protein [[Eubacterium] siraeum]MCM1487885.1 YihY/virulence factor BrkB family protein [Bacillota bacterium]